MLEFIKEPNLIILSYSSDYHNPQWVYSKIKEEGLVTLRGVFTVSAKELLSELDIENEDAPVTFKIADKDGDYYRFSKDILSLEHDLFIHKDRPLNNKTFFAERNISVFSKIDAVSDESIYIGGENENSIPEQVFDELLKNFPNSHELTKYTDARISAVISSYLTVKADYEESYQRYMNNKVSTVGANLREQFADYEIDKYHALLNKLSTMLDDEVSYSEDQWQEEILQIVLLLYPKYIHVFKGAPVRDTYSQKNRSIDCLLVDSTGNTDIIEIKKPFDQCIVTKRTYRDNYIPLRQLSGTVMQVEKYIFYLNKSGKNGEERLTKKYKSELADGFKIKVTSPSGIIIMGRDKGLSTAQRQDFEVIKRKYKNVIDIITYDDLIGRLKFTIKQWSKNT
jgi:hypothetical protein